MKYQNEILIDLPKAEVVALFDNPDNMKHWQAGLISYEHLSGTPGEPGAKMKLNFKQGKREIEMIETIISNDFPDSLTSTYETKGVFNHMVSYFDEVGPRQTRYHSENEFRFSGFMVIIGLLFKGTFPKQTQSYMEAFKAFAEAQKLSKA